MKQGQPQGVAPVKINGGEGGIRTHGAFLLTRSPGVRIRPDYATSPRQPIEWVVYSGRGGIRTHGGVAPTTVFETVPIVHSGTLPDPVRL
jgi:hypothetical protein